MKASTVVGLGFVFVATAFAGCWSALFMIDGQRAQVANASLRVCRHALQDAGIGPGQAKLKDIDAICMPLIDTSKIPNMVWHDCVTHACSTIRGCNRSQVAVIVRACDIMMPHNKEWYAEIK